MKIRWTRLARADIKPAYEYVAAASPNAADQFLETIHHAAEILLHHPSFAGRTVRLAGTRELVVSGKPWILPYRVRRCFIDILAVMHAARKWPEKSRFGIEALTYMNFPRT